MEILPEESTYSFKGGVWFVFKDKKNTIRFWLSSLNGAEKVFFNNELVIEKRNLTKLKSIHNYTSEKGDDYELTFSMKKGVRNFQLKKNKEKISDINLAYNKEKQRKTRGKIVLLLSIFIFVIAILMVFNQPSTNVFIVLGIGWLLILIVLFSNKQKMIFEDNKIDC